MDSSIPAKVRLSSVSHDKVTASVPPLSSYPVGGLEGRFPGARTDRPVGRTLGDEGRLSQDLGAA